jgi:hypothetical protein
MSWRTVVSLALLLSALFWAVREVWAEEQFSIRKLVSPATAESFRIEARGVREVPGDLAPAQVFELVNLTGQPVKLGRLATSCGCIVLLSAKDEYAAGERIEVTLHNIRPSSGHTYAFFVNVESPVRQMLQQEVYVISDGYAKK